MYFDYLFLIDPPDTTTTIKPSSTTSEPKNTTSTSRSSRETTKETTSTTIESSTTVPVSEGGDGNIIGRRPVLMTTLLVLLLSVYSKVFTAY